MNHYTLNPFKPNPNFDSESAFNIKKFDIILGNPPYVRHELFKLEKPLLEEYYEDFFSTRADLSVYFFKRGFELLKEGGILSYISTNKILATEYSFVFKKFLKEQTVLLSIIKLEKNFFNNKVTTLVITLTKQLYRKNKIFKVSTIENEASSKNLIEEVNKNVFVMKQDQLDTKLKNKWVLEPPEVLDLLAKLNSAGPSFKEQKKWSFHRGLCLGFIKAFLINEEQRKRFLKQNSKNKEIIIPTLRGRHIKSKVVNKIQQHIILIEDSAKKEWPWSDKQPEEAEQIFSEEYPFIHKHLVQYRNSLIKRNNRGTYYWESVLPSFYYDLFQTKLVIKEINREGNFSLDKTGSIPIDTVAIILSSEENLLVLFALLNSKLFNWYYRYNFPMLGSSWKYGALRFFNYCFRNLSIVSLTESQEKVLRSLASKILKASSETRIKELQK